ncbi:ATP-binding cassette domain-containing protein [Mesorhizobium sp. VK23B]|uniref:ATP-binding cassette domain-containing protein n=1 Tax=Mesorhizobium dulcispinae TaxID=3072316 RepID=A0ABU4XBF1_9HYPH|nr:MULTISPECIES: ATP-binding cassette domain-containing protein [unclassified Mesorhizobium]MDX8465682.1 ATP-binding cassette domain-containing protein [Mesorhizobium sp. VK23B]MDX8471516.1 ATP-binding cassette domain-containing protein [Mesorhizobium sp. VK23A]
MTRFTPGRSNRAAAFGSSILPGRRDELLLVALVLIAVAGFSFAHPDFLTILNLLNIGQQSAIVAVVAFGMTAVIIARGIDISVGGTMAASGIIAALVLQATGSGVLGILAAMLSGGFLGAINAGLIAWLRISPFVATLGTMALARGAALSLSKASSIPVSDPLMLWPGEANLFGIPAGFVLAILLCAVWGFLLKRTAIGRSTFAVGGNEIASRASLVPVRWIQSFTYVACGVSSGIAAIIGIGRLGSAQPLAGTGLEFAAITAAVVGGARLSGGKGSVAGTLLGAIAIGTINSGLAFLQVSQQVIYIISGALILLAVLVRGDLPLRAIFRSRRSIPARRSTDHGDCLKVDRLSKQFGTIRVLSDVSFELKGGEVVALVGENGAGKSTLIKCLSGVHVPDGGTIAFGRAKKTGATDTDDIAVIHQHFSLVPDLTIAESLSLGREPTFVGFLRRYEMRRRAARALRQVGLDRDVNTPVRDLTVGERQMLEVAKALLASAWLIVMDEPTSALSNRERDQLYAIVRKLAERGSCVLYISHKMEEVKELAARALVLRDGKLVGDVPMSDITERELIHLMVGRDIGNVFPWVPSPLGDTIITVASLSTQSLLRDVSFAVKQGEVLGLAGLMGSGRTEILRCIAGLDSFSHGSIELRGKSLGSGNQSHAAGLGVAFIPEDRRLEGLVGCLSVRDNLGLVWMKRNRTYGIVSVSSLTRKADELIRKLDIRPPVPGRLAGTLSGGNQQKVVLGKWLAVNPTIILLDEPTSGVDVGAKSEIHRVIGELKTAGAAIVLVSSELPELLGVSDRIVVIREGRSVGELPRGATEQEVMELAFSAVESIGNTMLEATL